ncbi:sensor histidine kinase [Streptomyces yaizuensis]|uniref:histidine kinase n=1 Tax=Streptomyces yaizuensis TaxID=2989713 RepID=A0ABQ5P1V9_9ACTN|nr:nitrate- and nitrite sensing domain-containing protein [Streptomyces sp. YSPA8]GLF96470.1 nitrate- and nitrite sensing domain-containing protein [Streptomyces sp. YSPA8]
MRFRGKSIRRKIVALLLVPLVSMSALWAFATILTGREANELWEVGEVTEKLGPPVVTTLQVLQDERRQTLVYLADRSASGALPALDDRRRATNRAVDTLKRNASRQEIRDDMRPDAERRLSSLLKGFDGLPALRRSVESGTVTRAEALDYYNRMVDPGFGFLSLLHAIHDVSIERQGRALVGVARAAEMLSREDALITSALTAGRVTSRETRALSDLVAHRELYYDINLETLPAKERAIYVQFWRSAETAPLRGAEERLIENGSLTGADRSDIEEWRQAAAPVLAELRREARAGGVRYQDRVDPAARTVFLQAGAAGVLGFLALLVSLVVSVRIGRALIRDLSRLRKEAHEVSGVRLPSVMRRLASGEQVDVETEAPRLEYDKDEIGQAGQALNTLQRAAVEAAVRQAEMRRGVSEVFVNLARRNQVLLHRQLTLLDTMERRTEDTGELADLFRLDHLTTRMRRHAEGLVILSGAAPSRQWRNPVQLMDVVRAAVAEVEDYERIEVRRLPRIGVGGPAVADLTHLIAELLENATVFSPPHTGVQVVGERVANGFTLEIHDRGLGMAPEVLLEANMRLAETPEFELSDTDRLGLFVVSRLAQRQGVRVSLQPSPYGGTTAIVFIPAPLLTEAPEDQSAGFRLDRRSEGTGGRREGESRLSALTRSPGASDRAQGPGRRGGGPLDGPVELEAPLRSRDAGPDPLSDVLAGPGALTGPRALTDPAQLTDPDTLLGLDREDSEPDGLFRPRPRAPRTPRRATPDEQRRQAPVPAQEHPPAPVPLPRRKPPTLVADHGRRVDEPGRAHPSPVADPATDRVTHPTDPAARTATDPTPTDRSGAAGSPDQPGQPRRKPAPATIDGLPRRVRQASLAPQLRANGPADRPPAPAADDDEAGRDAEQVRARMASMQRGWQRGRRQNAQGDDDAERTTGAAPGPRAPRTTSEGDGP